ncbi:tripartite tricarboxylate transporter substrate-binding protein [Roseiarcaceae bacterium H3SJ34-1]|uniref:Bug family tripartite tricarboxylate transporter substrate binding protein n=1 Tax=Terripilifer ovatus TaxID=3032367 RepID=UPI003AB997A7|nr:tripartite tricarboxylate transporter substrate-binding protein [Roseiarcaceae bacterium H3SJ34-1]
MGGRSTLVAFALALCAAAPAASQPLSTITITVGTSAGGTYDASARLLARHMGQYLPGNPQFVVQNLPGGGGLVAFNQLANTAPRDGSVMTISDGAVLFEALFGNPTARFDARKLNWIGSRARETPLCVAMARKGVNTIQDARQREVVVGAIGGTRTDNSSRLANALLGTKFKIVTGYPGSSEIVLALERGEVEGMCGWSWTTIKRRVPDWLRDKKLNLLVQTGVEKAPDLPDVPLALDLAKTDEERDIMRLLISDTQIATPLVAPPDVPAPRVAELRNAFDKAMQNPQLLADAQQQQIDIDPTPGVKLQAAVDHMFTLPKPIVANAKAIFRK